MERYNATRRDEVVEITEVTVEDNNEVVDECTETPLKAGRNGERAIVMPNERKT